MSIKQILLIILMINISSTGLAADFQSNRENSSYFVTVTPWALSNGSPSSYSYTLGIYFTRRISLDVELGRLSYDYETGDFDGETNYSNIGFGGRYFSRNSLNFLASVHFRKWEGKTATTGSSGAYGEAEIYATSTAAIIGIGNQWITDFGLIIGIDWVVIAEAINSSYSVSVTKNEGLSSSELQAFVNDAKKKAESVNSVAFASAAIILNLGWSF